MLARHCLSLAPLFLISSSGKSLPAEVCKNEKPSADDIVPLDAAECTAAAAASAETL